MMFSSTILQLLSLCCIFRTISCVYIKGNEYKAISVSFSNSVEQEVFDFNKFKEVLLNASEILHRATKTRSYFEEFLINIKSSVDDAFCDDNHITSPPAYVDIYIVDPSEVATLKAQHSRGCREQGDLIYIPSNWLQGDVKDLARDFVRQWAIFRYGVFEEEPERYGSCFSRDGKTWSPTGCYNLKLNEELNNDDVNGLPTCFYPPYFSEDENLNSSLMFRTNSSNVLHFCDGSKSHPHNPLMETTHNRLCNGMSVWSIIRNSDDFKFGKYKNMYENRNRVTTLKCYQEPSIHLSLAVQTGSEKDIKKIVKEIRYSLLRFLYYQISANINVSLVTFGGEANVNGIILNFANKEELETILGRHIIETGYNSCLSCGLDKALKMSQEDSRSLPMVVLIAFESALFQENVPEFIQMIENNPQVVTHIILIKDMADTAIPPSLLDGLRRTGGQFFYLPQEAALMKSKMNVILATAAKSPLRVEHEVVVVHKAIYTNISSDFTDTFTTEKGMIGKLVYTMICNNTERLQPVNSKCSTWDKESDTYTCGGVYELLEEMAPKREWKYAYEFVIGKTSLNCYALATVRLEKNSAHLVTLRGWLNYYTIKPGENALIIYAEIIKNVKTKFRVEARIYSPSLELTERIELRDNGNGDPDTKKGDNIYSRYFTNFHETGIHFVTISAKSVATDEFGKADKDTEISTISRTSVIGSFIVEYLPPEEHDIYPPNRIMDLRVASVNHENRTVMMQWTAPGNDYDSGIATGYKIRYSPQWANLLDPSFNDEDNSLLLSLEQSIVPKRSGMLESHVFHCPKIQDEEVYYVALKATDSNDDNKVSNIVQVYIKSLPETTTKSQPYFTEVNSKSSISEYTSNGEDNFTLYHNYTITTYNESSQFTTAGENSTVVFPTQPSYTDCLDKHLYIMIVSPVAGGILLIIIIINIVVCCCISKRHPKEPKKLSRNASLRPPHNMKIAYRQDSQTSLETDNLGASISSLGDKNLYYTPQKRRDQPEYTYHTTSSLRRDSENEHSANALGFKVVTAMPAYATTSLARYAARLNDTPDSVGTKSSSASRAPNYDENNDDSHLYELGLV